MATRDKSLRFKGASLKKASKVNTISKTGRIWICIFFFRLRFGKKSSSSPSLINYWSDLGTFSLEDNWGHMCGIGERMFVLGSTRLKTDIMRSSHVALFKWNLHWSWIPPPFPSLYNWCWFHAHWSHLTLEWGNLSTYFRSSSCSALIFTFRCHGAECTLKVMLFSNNTSGRKRGKRPRERMERKERLLEALGVWRTDVLFEVLNRLE